MTRSHLKRGSSPIICPSCLSVALENLIMVGQGDLSLVLHFLVPTPVFLTLVLFPGHLLIFFYDLTLVSGSASKLLIFEHASHSKNGLLLSSPIRLFLPLYLSGCHPFTPLLVSPVFLVLSVELHALLVHYDRKDESK